MDAHESREQRPLHFAPDLGDAVRVYGPKAPVGREGLDRWRPRWT